jgi:DNA repair exonuclease SbcCD ATPase subunit
MIVSLELDCFGKHVKRTFPFTEGLNAIRGANEDGKSTMLLGIQYALYGVKALPLPLDEYVTYGHKENELKVALIIKVRDEMFLFTRGKSGAECKHSGGIVTGQTEVTKFATELLGADAEKASKLMFASQKNMSAAMEGGPTALSSYIEDLSGMDLFDIILEEATSKLVTGPTTTLDIAISNLEEVLKVGEPISPDLVAMDVEQRQLKTKSQNLQRTLDEKLKPAAEEAAAAYHEAHTKNTVREQARLAYNKACMTLHTKQCDHKEAGAKIVTVDTDRIKELEGVIADQQKHATVVAAYNAFSKLVYPEDFWTGSHDELIAEGKQAVADERHARDQIAEHKAGIREARARIVTASVCGFCKQDTAQFPEVKVLNDQLSATILRLEKLIEVEEAGRATAHETMVALQDVAAEGAKWSEFHARYNQYLYRDDSQVPCILTWLGDPPKPAGDIAAMEKELKALKDAKHQVEQALMKTNNLAYQIEDMKKEIAEMEQLLPEVIDLEPLAEAKAKATKKVSDSMDTIKELDDRYRDVHHQMEIRQIEFTRLMNEYEDAKKRKAAMEVERKTLNFNNTLIKKVKAARPIVAAKLWHIVLASVSTMFSDMRGETSVVERGTKGFTINGRNALGVSGSTQDILGLAMRVSLLRTFIPDCPFMVLDEPMAACDEDRSKEMLAFITTCGFDQTLLVTHEDTSQQFATNVIVL